MFFRDFYKKILTVILTVCLLSTSVFIPVHADNNNFDNYIYINDIKVSPYVHLKVLKTGFMQDNYAKFTINGNLLDIEFASPPFGPNGRVYFDHVYGNAADSKGQKLIITDWQGTAKEMTEESYVNFYASPVKMTIQLKNVPYNVVNISKMVQNRDGSYSGKYVYYYDYFIKNSDGEFSFAFPRPYFDNVHMSVQLKSPNSYLDIKLYDPGAYHGLAVSYHEYEKTQPSSLSLIARTRL